MTDRIDLDDLETATDEEEGTGNRGDWLWRDDGAVAPVAESDSPASTASGSANSSSGRESGDSDSNADETAGEGADENAIEPDRAPAPHVPQTGESTPVGIPSEGSGSGSGGSASGAASANGTASSPESESLRPMGSGATAASETGGKPASGPHGGGPDEMTMAITYAAVRRLERPAAVFASAYEWSDWVGIVGDVPVHVVQKFQRDRGIDVDFFNGTGTGPGERLAQIDRNSMFFAERTVVVGLAGEDDPIAEAADWEFVPLETAAAKADWALEGDSS